MDGRVGCLIDQRAVVVLPNDTCESLSRRVMEEAEWSLMTDAVRLFCAGKLSVQNNRVLITT